MNKIMKKLKIVGYETITIIKFRQNHSSKDIKDIQLALNFEDTQSIKKDNKK